MTEPALSDIVAHGSVLSAWVGRFITLPGYIGAMLVAALVRNLAGSTGALRIEARTVDDLGAFAYWITFRVMGKDYDAAVMSAGHCGFGLGAIDFSNAIVITAFLNVIQRRAPAPQARHQAVPASARADGGANDGHRQS